ncbi:MULTISPECIES: Fur family transcriptional regulator [Paraclostridium]|uniref:Ferric uptake regulator family protein n=2 Tax=Paraclostridium bifermentans TaxID=1490 RepID=T4VRY9_PARBF|nr:MULTISPECIES: transcriptional repressor [Paraclostridium]KGJ49970.1 Fur family transcriptional regulator [Clostridium sp. NCR]MDM8127671.1 transcriptional repressor [Paraclostridium benzoelyticum]MDV8114760.1 transcriptional repressor [Bacillus sp. BAU-SS-2023]EQK43457.1 ferric uptake regulator family protein [[Clostridium] bifermentans ATCC 638] [Paraclostridium bifermentans ATCC 638 = DSM 14991]EQK46467.1 ferric uptake regulator family protein [[Clostridium] bifermentans ATCC 19299] [Para
MKFSKQRELILNAVKDNTVHPTADFIYDYLKKDNPNLSLGTVYRNLSQLVNHGYIQKVSMPGLPDRFDANVIEHNHMICDVCGNIQDIHSDILKNIPSAISNELDIEITSCTVILHGICKNCK